MSNSTTPDGQTRGSLLDRLRAGWSELPHLALGRPAAERPAPNRVLVEDHLANCTMLRVLLQMRGYEVESASDGPEAVRKALTWRPDVAIVDIGLPGLDGYEVARQIKVGLGDRIRLVAFTSYGLDEDRKRAFDAGFDAHLAKPADADELFQLLLPA
jgi:CheY-like chemotaxis protein